MKALFFDIDGTLVDIKSHKIPESTTRALLEAKNNGNKIFIATGRSHTIVDLPGLPKDIIDGYVTLNGAICLADGIPVCMAKIPAETVREFSQICIDRNLTNLFVTMDGMKVANGDERFTTGFQTFFNLAPIPTTDFSSMLTQDVYQMTVFFDKSLQNPLDDLLTAIKRLKCHHARTFNPIIERMRVVMKKMRQKVAGS